ncbi:hypothetical protein SPRG_18974 [Saprolegnia parasitica CBS 223.65]|uniref:Uncharacterized protein n=1 Tax=Saprolegnia parasitica (strain CBS 223.65) TaxID=695850 RepID=A0A067CXI4_SAPPC|nr:hypothetical protein SPRG_18974 [Saprolegnia parasitica CBS 223.65]KDO33985.1 hypothetical protein SPRG_18974 [Saprolegnia parasitica CBS 223.65]|eukprot:XP_012195190.1 hypothetical protein SPRG_18974 [Saprolegnia parasitica CBS 223.65]
MSKSIAVHRMMLKSLLEQGTRPIKTSDHWPEARETKSTREDSRGHATRGSSSTEVHVPSHGQVFGCDAGCTPCSWKHSTVFCIRAAR